MPKARRAWRSCPELALFGSITSVIRAELLLKRHPSFRLAQHRLTFPMRSRRYGRELASAAPRGRLQRSDRIFVGLVARMVVRARTSGKTADVDALVSVLSKLGFTPTSSRLPGLCTTC
jgi:hypothetical protein